MAENKPKLISPQLVWLTIRNFDYDPAEYMGVLEVYAAFELADDTEETETSVFMAEHRDEIHDIVERSIDETFKAVGRGDIDCLLGRAR